MKQIKTVLVLCLAMVFGLAGCQEGGTGAEDVSNTTVILVRHAEKADDGTKDPPLDSLGQLRAAALGQVLRDVELTAVYSTSYKRTTETVEAIARASNLEVAAYDPGDQGFVNDAVLKNRGGSILISGHSNTVPALVNQLTGSDRLKNLEDWEYDFLYIVNLGKDTTLQVLHYGAPSVRPN
jgi:2,3-bisphosphoglycerate-dependent phosphoglycerate mutase